MFVFFHERIHLITGVPHGGHQPAADTAHPDTRLMGTGTLTRVVWAYWPMNTGYLTHQRHADYYHDTVSGKKD
jgi:hypothetical protein